MGYKKGLGIVCLLIEMAAFAYLVYLLFFTPALRFFPPGVRQFNFVFIWLLPFIEVLWGYADLTRGRVDAGRVKLAWGAAIATFGCVLLIVIGKGFTYPVRNELMRAVPVHILLPLAVYVLTRSATGVAGKNDVNVSVSSLGKFAINVVLSAGIIGLGIMATAWLIKSEIFSNSVIFIGFLPIPGMVMVATPLVPVVLGILYIWEHNK